MVECLKALLGVLIITGAAGSNLALVNWDNQILSGIIITARASDKRVNANALSRNSY